MTQQQGQQQPDGSKTFVHGTVTSVLFNANKAKRGGGSYVAAILNFMNTQGETKDQAWAMQVLDNPINAEIRNTLIQLSAQPGTPITLHKTKKGGYWNVDRIDLGHVPGVKGTAPAPAGAPGYPGAPPAAGGYPGYPQGAPAQLVPPQPAPAYPASVPGQAPPPAYPTTANPPLVPAATYGDGGKQRSKEQCMRGEAILAATNVESALVASRGAEYKFDIKRLLNNAEQLRAYIENGIAPPVPAPQAVLATPQPAAPPAPVAVPQPAPAPMAPPAPAYPQAPPPPAPAYPQQPAPAPAAPAAPVPQYPQAQPAPAPQQPGVQAAPQSFDDGFGG